MKRLLIALFAISIVVAVTNIHAPVEPLIEEETEYSDAPLGAISDIKNNLGTGLVAVWQMLDKALETDSHGTYTLTNSGVTYENLIQSGGSQVELSENDYYSLAHNANFEPSDTTDYSFCFWFKPESLSGVTGLISKEGSGTGYLVYTNGTTVQFIHQGVDQTGATTLSTGTLYHICAVYDGASTDTLKLYVSSGGTADATPATSPSPRGYNTSTATLKIGERSDASGNSDGVFGQVVFWKGYALTATNVADLYASGSGVPYDAGGGATPFVDVNRTVIFQDY